eukprot:7155544-Prymnesium_polylepis.1
MLIRTVSIALMTTASQRALARTRGENSARSRAWPRELVSSSSPRLFLHDLVHGRVSLFPPPPLGCFCMAPLGDAAKAAHTALWAQRHGGRVLGQERVQAKLV